MRIFSYVPSESEDGPLATTAVVKGSLPQRTTTRQEEKRRFWFLFYLGFLSLLAYSVHSVVV